MGTPIRAVIGYLVLLLVVRMLARRPGAQYTLTEFVIVVLVGGVVIRATTGGDTSVVNCTIAILTVSLMHTSVAWMKGRSALLSRLVDGVPIVLLERGRWRSGWMRRLRIEPEDVLAAARTKGVRSISEIRYAILERNGGISIIRERSSGP